MLCEWREYNSFGEGSLLKLKRMTTKFQRLCTLKSTPKVKLYKLNTGAGTQWADVARLLTVYQQQSISPKSPDTFWFTGLLSTGDTEMYKVFVPEGSTFLKSICFCKCA